MSAWEESYRDYAGPAADFYERMRAPDAPHPSRAGDCGGLQESPRTSGRLTQPVPALGHLRESARPPGRWRRGCGIDTRTARRSRCSLCGAAAARARHDRRGSTRQCASANTSCSRLDSPTTPRGGRSAAPGVRWQPAHVKPIPTIRTARSPRVRGSQKACRVPAAASRAPWIRRAVVGSSRTPPPDRLSRSKIRPRAPNARSRSRLARRGRHARRPGPSACSGSDDPTV